MYIYIYIYMYIYMYICEIIDICFHTFFLITMVFMFCNNIIWCICTLCVYICICICIVVYIYILLLYSIYGNFTPETYLLINRFGVHW